MLIATLAATAPALAQSDAVQFTPRQLRRISRFAPLPSPPPSPTNAVAENDAAARLGQFLFFDERMSGNRQVSCATCHRPDAGFADDIPLSRGVGDANRHTPALWNVVYNRWYFWDGRADTLWSQALDPIENPEEMDFTRLEVAHLIHRDNALRIMYEGVFGPLPELDHSDRFPQTGRPLPKNSRHDDHAAWSTMTAVDQAAVNGVFANVGKAIAAYERQIISRDSPFDRFVDGLLNDDASKSTALSLSAQRGLRLFVGDANCWLCHGGPNFSDGEFHDTRVPPLPQRPIDDPGRLQGVRRLLENPFNAAGEYADARDPIAIAKLEHLTAKPDFLRQFKTPSLRNVAQTPPYMHQGQIATLREVIEFYSTRVGEMPLGHHRQEQILVPLNLSNQDIDDLIAFLNSLTGAPLDPALSRQPALPDLSSVSD